MKNILFVTLLALLASCTGKTSKDKENAEEVEKQLAVSLLQGVWLDDNTGLPLLKVKGDSMYLASQANAPFLFTVSGDTLFAHGSEPVSYEVVELDEQTFQFYTSLGDLVCLHKSDTDTIPFGISSETMESEREVIEKDSVCYYGGIRYRGYVYINPSSKKVFHPTVTEEGLIVDNVYYDNIIHICIYQGKQCLFAKDIAKEMFEGIVPADFLKLAILSDMNFMGVGADGYHYRATVSMPDDFAYFNVDLNIGKEGVISYKLKE